MRVPDNFPLRHHFTKPVTRILDVSSYGLSAAEKKAYDCFESELGNVIVDGREAKVKVPKTWLPMLSIN